MNVTRLADDRHPHGWTPADITAVASAIRAYLDADNLEVSGQLFNSQVEEIAMQVWPVVEGKVRARIVDLLAQAAAGRREYAVNAPDDSALVLESEARQLDTVARLVNGDMSAMTAWLPSWRWTDEMTEHLR